MTCSVVCPACLKGSVPEIVFDREPEDGILDGSTRSEEPLLAACGACGEVFRARAMATRRGEVVSFTEVAGTPLLRAPCPQCLGIVGACAVPFIALPPTGGDYEWLETEADVTCPNCDYTWQTRVQVDLETRGMTLVPGPVVGPRWRKSFVVAKTTYARSEVYTIEEVRAFVTLAELEAWCEMNPGLFERRLHPGAYEYVRLRREDDRYLDMNGEPFG
jgi:hypothetical protein